MECENCGNESLGEVMHDIDRKYWHCYKCGYDTDIPEGVKTMDDGTMYIDGYKVTSTLPIGLGPEWTVFVAVTDEDTCMIECGVGAKYGQYIEILSRHLELEDDIQTLMVANELKDNVGVVEAR